MIAIALESFKEVFTKRIILLVFIMTMIYLSLYGLLAYFVFAEHRENNVNAMMLTMQGIGFTSILGFYFGSMIIVFFTIMASVGCISSEIESGIINAVLTKPIKRVEYLLGKYLGLSIMVIIYTTFIFTSIFIINNIINIPPLNNISIITILKGYLIFLILPLSLLSLTIFGSVKFKTLNNGIVVIGIYIFGLIGSMMEQIGGFLTFTNGIEEWGIVISLISPFDAVYRKMISVLFSSFNLSSASGPVFLNNKIPSDGMMAYVVIYSLILVGVAIMNFQKKEIS